MTRCAALVVAAGRGSRAGGDVPKQWRHLAGRPVLRHTLNALAAHPDIDSIQVVIHEDDRALYDEAVIGLSLPPVAIGGSTRQESVRAGLEAMTALAPDLVLIHDAARPFVAPEVIGRVIDALGKHEGAVPALPLPDTLATNSGVLIDGFVPRDGLWRIQTPQGFRFAPILAAHRKAVGQSLTDDSSVAARAGLAVALVAGSEENVKLTSAEDMSRASTRLEAAMETRVGFGFDVHRFVPGSSITLCGLVIPHDAALEGHSDADAGLHALTDAILGAMADGDIGVHFPPTDERWRGADSARFLDHAMSLLRARGGAITHLDVTIICERPKISPHRMKMAARIAEILKIDAGRVSVKATTTEGLGFTGRREGIAAQAVATIRLPASSPY